MPQQKIALLGFGHVGQSLVRLFLRKETELKKEFGISFVVTGIATRSHGMAINPNGIDSMKAIELVESDQSLERLSSIPALQDNFDFIRKCSADILFENTPVNHMTGQPAVDYICLALKNGMHAITANKGPVVHAYHELTKLAQSKNRKFFFESTVMDGAPIFSLFRDALPAAQIKSFRGILNSTTNLILGRMENGESFNEAMKYAQSIGIAETDPSADVDGWDAAIKVAALCTVLMDIQLKPQQVKRQGIRDINQEKIIAAKEQGKRWKLVCSAMREGREVTARVHTEMVGIESPMYSVDNTTSIIEFETDVLGLLSLVEKDPGPHTTAYGLLADFINAVKA